MKQIPKKEQIKLELEGTTKQEVIKELISLIDKSGNLTSKEEFYKDILAREKKGSTGMGKRIAIPHVRSHAVEKTTVAFARSKEGVDFNSLDDKAAKLFFMLAVPKQGSQEYLDLLTHLSQQLRYADFRNKLLEAESKEKIRDILAES